MLKRGASSADPIDLSDGGDAKRLHYDSESTAEMGDESAPDHASQSSDVLAFRLLRTQGLTGVANQDAVSLTDIIRGPLEHCFLSNYMFDMDWMMRMCPILKQVPVTLIHSPNDRSTQMFCSLMPNIRAFGPRLPPYGTHHSKMIICFRPDGVQVVIHTANMITEDWLYKTQGAWMMTFPRKADPSSASPSPFERDLCAYLRAVGGPAGDVAARLSAFDFSSCPVVLVASVPGSHQGADLQRWGHMRIRHILRSEPVPASFARSPLVAQISSMGSLDAKWLTEEFATSFGCSSVQVVWPTVDTVRNCIEGWSGGGSLPLASKNMKTFTRYSPGTGELAWFLLTSSNLSKAAWGQLQLKGQQLKILSYEVGVLFLPSRFPGRRFVVRDPVAAPAATAPAAAAASAGATAAGSPSPTRLHPFFVGAAAAGAGAAAAAGSAPTAGPALVFPVPHRLPPQPYADTDAPWVVDEPHAEPDLYGRMWRTGGDSGSARAAAQARARGDLVPGDDD